MLAAGVPLIVPLEALKFKPSGRAPVTFASVGVGNPLVVIVNEPGVFATKLAVVALVIAGAWLTAREKLWVAGVPAPLSALKVML